MKSKLKYLITAILVIVFSCSFAMSANAEEIIDTEAVEITEENVFSKAYNELTEYAGEILCAMTFAGSVILAIAYKKRLMPLVKGSLVSIGNAVSKIKESTSEGIEKGSEIGEAIEQTLSGVTDTLDALAKRVDELDTMLKDRLKAEDGLAREREETRLILSSQIDMLYDIFMTSALPQYQKDAVGEKIAKMKGALGENADRN